MLHHFLRINQMAPIIFAPVPKSASRTLLKCLEKSFETQTIECKSSGGIGHFQIDEMALRRHLIKGLIKRKRPLIYQHFLPTSRNLECLKKHMSIEEKPKVIVSVRDIYDTAVSCADHQKKDYGPWWIDREENQFFKSDRDAEHSYYWNTMICMKFYASWAIAAKLKNCDVLFVQYDDIVQKPNDIVAQISSFYNFDVRHSFRDLIAIKENVNFGKSGRGLQLPKNAKRYLRDYADTFEGVDFSLIGL